MEAFPGSSNTIIPLSETQRSNLATDEVGAKSPAIARLGMQGSKKLSPQQPRSIQSHSSVTINNESDAISNAEARVKRPRDCNESHDNLDIAVSLAPSWQYLTPSEIGCALPLPSLLHDRLISAFRAADFEEAATVDLTRVRMGLLAHQTRGDVATLVESLGGNYAIHGCVND